MLGIGTEDPGKKLFDIEAITTPAVSEGKILVIDPSAVASALSPLDVAASEDVLFGYDSSMMRVILTIGWALQHVNHIGVVSVDCAIT